MSQRVLAFPRAQDANARLLVNLISLIVDAIAIDSSAATVEARQDESGVTVIDIVLSPTDLVRFAGEGGSVREAIHHYVNAFKSEHGGLYRLAFGSGS